MALAPPPPQPQSADGSISFGIVMGGVGGMPPGGGDGDELDEEDAEELVEADGDVLGDSDGDVLGEADVDSLGESLGEALGETDGELLGETDGDVLVDDEADTLGEEDGDSLGLPDGETLGLSEGEELGLGSGHMTHRPLANANRLRYIDRFIRKLAARVQQPHGYGSRGFYRRRKNGQKKSRRINDAHLDAGNSSRLGSFTHEPARTTPTGYRLANVARPTRPSMIQGSCKTPAASQVI